jgi:hypothetical protein
MQKKNDLQASFKSRKDKIELSVADIDRIAEQVEKPEVIVKKVEKPEKLEVAAKSIPKSVAKTIVEEDATETIKTSLDFPVALYEEMKIGLFRKRRSMKDYIIDLVRQDLYGKK